MTRTDFEAMLQNEGYAISEGNLKPDERRPLHTHGFDVRLFVLEGAITIVGADDRRTYGVGETVHVPAGILHAEHADAEGARYVVGRNSAPQVSAAG